MELDLSPDEAIGPGAVRSVSRALALLSLFHPDRQTVTLREMVDETGLARTTVARLIGALEHEGLVWAVGTHEYAVGPGLLRWAALATTAFRLPADAQAAVRALADAVDETASVYVRDGARRVCIAQEECDQPLRHVGGVGREGPLWRGATARVLLDGLDDRELAEIAQASPQGAGGVDDLRRWRAQVADEDFAFTENERADGLSVAAVPVRDRRGRTIAALSIAGPSQRVTVDRKPELRAALHTARAQIEAGSFVRVAHAADTLHASTRDDAREGAGRR